jgi:tetratricopeptide (TPR) repeat protein
VVVVALVPFAVVMCLQTVLALTGANRGGPELMNDDVLKGFYKEFRGQVQELEGTSEEYLGRAMVLAAQRDPIIALDALKAYKSAVVLDPESEGAWLGIASLYPDLRGSGALDLGSAVMIASKVSSQYPDRPAPFRIKAAIYDSEEDWENAQDEWRQVTERAPDDRSAHMALGRVRVAGGRVDSAAQAFERAHELHAGDGDALAALAEAQQRRGEYAAALEIMERIRSELGETRSYLLAMAGLFDKSGLPERAVGYLDRILANHPKNLEALTRRAVLRYQELGNLGGSQSDFEAALRNHTPDLNPLELRNLWVHLGTVQAMQGNDEEAVVTLTKAWDTNKKDPTALYHLARVQTRRGNGEAMEDPLRKVLGDADAPAALFAVYGELVADPAKLRTVVRALEKALRKSPDYVPAYYSLLSLQYGVQNFVEAKDTIDALYRVDRIERRSRAPSRAFFDPSGMERLLGTAATISADFRRRDPGADAPVRLQAMHSFDSGDFAAAAKASLKVMGTSSAPIRAYQAASLAWLGGRIPDLKRACDEGMKRRFHALLRYPCGRLAEDQGAYALATKYYEEMMGQSDRDLWAVHGLARLEHRQVDLERLAVAESGVEAVGGGAALDGHLAKARDGYRRVLEADPDFIPARRDLLLLSLAEPPALQRP